MRPRSKYKLNLRAVPQTKERQDQFRVALQEFVEAIVRLEIKRLRSVPTTKTTESQSGNHEVC